jgi:hypothetical protein
MLTTSARVQTQQLVGKAASVNTLLRKHVLERVVPAVASLKSALEEARHPLQRQALQCLVRLMLEHKEHMEEALVTQRQLAAEIKFNIQESQKAARQQRKAAEAGGAGERLTPQASEAALAALPELPAAPGAGYLLLLRCIHVMHAAYTCNAPCSPNRKTCKLNKIATNEP